jgi:hypothetical protein
MLPLVSHAAGFQVGRSLDGGLVEGATSCQMVCINIRAASRHAIACVDALIGLNQYALRCTLDRLHSFLLRCPVGLMTESSESAECARQPRG